MKAHQETRTTAIGPRQRSMIVTLMLGLLLSATSALGQGMRFFPLRSAPLGSPPGTLGEPVTPEFNKSLGCWELKVQRGVEVDIDVQGFGWGNAPGSPTLGAIQATVDPAGYSNGFGGDLNPKGWPTNPGAGWYQARNWCDPAFGGDGSPCNTGPFGPCAAGVCVFNPDWVMPAGLNEICGICFPPTLDYAWAAAAQNALNVDDGTVKTFGGLILDVPFDAAGTYVIAMDPDPNNTFMTSGTGTPIPDVVLTPACITVLVGACCVDTDSDGNRDTCHDDAFESECVAADGLYLGDAVLCTGIVGACCLDGDGDGWDDTCRVMDRLCCDTQGGSFLGAGTTCSNAPGACALDSTGDGFQDTCRVMDQTCCHARDGTFRGAGSLCSTMLGACCLDFDRICVEIDLANCVEQHGRFQGPNTVCQGDEDGNGSDDVCGEAIPAVSEWGLIVMTLALLVGIKVRFGRLIAARPGEIRSENCRPELQRSPDTVPQAHGVHPIDAK